MEVSYTKVIPRRKQNVASDDSQNQIIRRKNAKKLCIACWFQSKLTLYSYILTVKESQQFTALVLVYIAI